MTGPSSPARSRRVNAGSPRTITADTARRLFVTRQRLADPSADPTATGLLDVVRDLGCLQLDPTSVVAPNHVLVPWSRVGSYERAALEGLRWDERQLFDYWAHAASIVLVEDLPIHRVVMRRFRTDETNQTRRIRTFVAENRALHRHILRRLRAEGPLAARQIEDRSVQGWVSTGWTNERNVDRLLTFLWVRGDILVAGRQGQQRLWDLAERVLPPWAPTERLTVREAVRRASQRSLRALGVARARDIRLHYTREDYPGLDDVLVEHERRGRIVPVEVRDDGRAWPGRWHVHARDLDLVDRIEAGDWSPRTTLLSPFDNLICDRARTELVFGFRYRLEIYTPKGRREFGFYTMPVLHGDRLIGRVDPRMDRARGVLEVLAVHLEPGVRATAEVRKAVGSALRDLGRFLGAREVSGGPAVPTAWRRAL